MREEGNGPKGGRGALYVVSTPIGNLEDMTFRAVATLKRVGLVAAEGVRQTKRLCSRYAIPARLTAYNQHNRKSKGAYLLEKLESGLDVALVTNAGTPGISDPGVYLVNRALASGIRVVPVPGPSAATTALSVCGMRADSFVFVGFLPNRSGKRKKALEDLASEPRTLVLFEAPHRLLAMLADALKTLGDRPAVLMRELTKMYEEVLPGTLSALQERMKGRQVKGEITLVVSGGEKERETVEAELRRRLENLLKNSDKRVREIAEQVAREEGVPFRTVYKTCLSIKGGRGE